MITHIVMWKFKDGEEARANEFLEKLQALDGQIDVIRKMKVVRSAVKGAEYDAVLISEFDTLEDVSKYKNDPRHLSVAALCEKIRVSRAAIDIES